MDRDLAALYGIPTFRFNEAVKRNQKRFPGDFMFQLTAAEYAVLTSQTAMSKLEEVDEEPFLMPSPSTVQLWLQMCLIAQA